MKRILCFLATFMLSVLLVGCSNGKETETDLSPLDIAAVIAESQSELPPLIELSAKDEAFAEWLSDYYLLPAEQIEDGAILYAEGVEVSEIAVLVISDESSAVSVKAALEGYIESRESAFAGYAPQQAAIAGDGIVAANGRYVALLICPEPREARNAFLSCFEIDTETESETASEPEPKEEPQVEDNAAAGTVYNHEAILQAWRSGDDAGLSDSDSSILEAAKNVIEEKIDDGMSEYEKELTIHDFITGWASFSYGIFSRSSGELADGSDTPYGVLIDRSAMCHGYSSTFQLFMDMLDIECITVFGTPSSSGVQHSWNMVKLEDEWYCVDCAWDDPIGGSPGHTYFNVTSDFMRSGSIHRWDDTAVPEATGTAYAYQKN